MSNSSKRRRKKRKSVRINIRFAIVAFGLIGSGACGIHLLHVVQIQRNAKTLLAHATLATQQGSSRLALRRYQQYLALRPDDIDVVATAAMLLQDNAQSSSELARCYFEYENVLRHQNRDDIRRRLVDVAIQLRRFNDGQWHLDQLLKSSPNDGELKYKAGLCAEGEGDFELAVNRFRNAITNGYHDPAVYNHLTTVLLDRLSRPDEAVSLTNEMVDKNPKNAEALGYRAQFNLNRGERSQAQQDVDRAAAIAPNNPMIVLLSTQLVLEKESISVEEFQAATEHIEQTLNTHGDDVRLYERFGQLELRRGRIDNALEVLRRGIDSVNEHDRIGLVVQVADLLIAAGRAEEAKPDIQRLETNTRARPFRDYLRGRLLMVDRQFAAAVHQFRRARFAATKLPTLLQTITLQMIDCLNQTGQFEELLVECKQVLATDSTNRIALAGRATALRGLGRNQEAIQAYGVVSNVQTARQIAELELAKNLRLSENTRDWQPFEKALAEAKDVDSDRVAVGILEAAATVARGQQQAAAQILESLETIDPSDPRVPAARIRLDIRLGVIKDAWQRLDTARQSHGDSLTLRLAEAELFAAGDSEEPQADLSYLIRNIDQFPKTDQIEFLTAIATIAQLSGDLEFALLIMTQVAEHRPDRIQIQLSIFRLAMQLGDKTESAHRLNELRRIEGPNGPTAAYAEALQLIQQVQLGRTVSMSSARILMKRAESRRTDWYLPTLGLAAIEELEGDELRAAAKYRESIEKGCREPTAIERSFTLLRRHGRHREADTLLNLIRQDVPPPIRPLVMRLSAESAVWADDPERGFELARSAVQPDSQDAEALLWFANLAKQLGKFEAAETSLRRAVKLEPTQRNSRVSLVQLLAEQNRKSEALQVIDEANRQPAGDERHRTLATCFELIKQFDRAEEHYLAVLKNNPDGPIDLRAVASFYVRMGHGSTAKPLLEKLLNLPTGVSAADRMSARRELAVAIAGDNEESFLRAVSLIDENILVAADSSVEQVVKARLLGARPDPDSVRDAVLILESVMSRNELSKTDTALLARMYDALGQTEQADQQWGLLLDSQSVIPELLILRANRLLNWGRIQQAKPVIERLWSEFRDAPHVSEVRLRLLALSGNTSAISQMLDSKRDLTAPNVTADSIASAADTLSRVARQRGISDAARDELLDTSQRLYQRIVDDKPQARLAVAQILALRGKPDDALKVLEETTENLPPEEIAMTITTVANKAKLSRSQIRQAEQLLAGLTQKNRGIALLHLAELHQYTGRMEDAIRIYQQILEFAPNNVLVLNNLAWLLSTTGSDPDAALRRINQAISIAGPTAALLDTRGMVYLNRGEPKRAISDLQQSAAVDPSPGILVHLAMAFARNRNRSGAQLNMRESIAGGFQSREHLHPVEASLLDSEIRQLVDDFGSN